MIYTFHIQVPAGDEFEITPYNLDLKYINRYNAKYIAQREFFLEGKFDVVGNDLFDIIFNAINTYGYLQFFIKNTSNIVVYNENDFSNAFVWDFNKKIVTFKFDGAFVYPKNSFFTMKKERLGGGADNFYYISILPLTNKGIVFDAFLESFFNDLDINFDKSDMYYDTGEDLSKYFLCNINDIFGIYTNGGGGDVLLNNENIMTIMEIIFRLYLYTDYNSGLYKFKRVQDLVTNIIDLTEFCENLKRYDNINPKLSEKLDFNSNNLIGGASDFQNFALNRNFGGDDIVYQINKITTRLDYGGSGYQSDSVFLGEFNTSTFDIISANGAISGVSILNGNLATANIIKNRYNQFVYSENASIIGNSSESVAAPYYFNDFIEMPKIDIKGDFNDFRTFYDGIKLYEYDNHNYIGRTRRQIYDFSKNITTFECSLFYKEPIT